MREILIILIVFGTFSAVFGIACNFTYLENSPGDSENLGSQTLPMENVRIEITEESFECETLSIAKDHTLDFGDDYEDDNSCEEEIRTINPQKMSTTANEMKPIVIQQIQIRECRRKGASCQQDDPNYVCIQKFIKIVQKHLDPFGQELNSDIFYVPSACSCGIIKFQKTSR